MPPRLEMLDAATWREFVAAPVAVLVLGKTTCPACQAYTEELAAFLDRDAPDEIRFGKMLYRHGERWKDFAGGGVERIRRRLDTLPAAG